MTKFKEKLNLNGRLSLLLPYLIIAALFIITPMIFLFVKTVSPEGGDHLAILKNNSMWKIMWRSIWTGLIAAFICLIIAIPFSYFVATSKKRIFKILSISLMISPLFVFTIVKAFALKGTLLYMFDGAENGKKLNNEFIMILGMIYLYMPFMVIPIYSLFNDMPKSLIEASHDQGYNGFWTLLKVIIPYSSKAIFSGFALVFMLASTSLIISHSLLPDGSQKRMIGNLIDVHSHPINKFETATASTLALITIAIISSIYISLNSIPKIVRKIKGGIDV